MNAVTLALLFVCVWSVSGNSTFRPTPDPDFECPNYETAYYNHPTDCSAFYLCTNGLAWYNKCPHGLYFNINIKACDWPQNVECNVQTTTESAGTSSP